jgi:hypothetical protein
MSAYSDLRLDIPPTALRPSILIWAAQSRTCKNARRASANLAAQYATRRATRCWIRDDRGLQGNPLERPRTESRQRRLVSSRDHGLPILQSVRCYSQRSDWRFCFSESASSSTRSARSRSTRPRRARNAPIGCPVARRIAQHRRPDNPKRHSGLLDRHTRLDQSPQPITKANAVGRSAIGGGLFQSRPGAQRYAVSTGRSAPERSNAALRTAVACRAAANHRQRSVAAVGR